MHSQPEKDDNLREQIQILRQDVLKKNLEIVKLQDAQKGKESRSVTESFSLSPRRRTPSPERKGVQDSSKDFNVEGLLGLQNAEEKKEIESLRSKLKSVTDICTQQENHFSKLVKGLEHKLSEAITGRDELLTLRQQESGTQQQLIYQLQAALQQTKTTVETQKKELLDSDKHLRSAEEKFCEAQAALLKVHNVLKDEEMKRGNTNMLTEVTAKSHSLYSGDLLTQVLSHCLNEDEAKISDMKLKNHEIEKQLQETKNTSESDKVTLIREYESKLVDLKTDHAKSLDIAANRTLNERNRIGELRRDMEENRVNYEKSISDHKGKIASLEKNIKTCREEFEGKTKQHQIQHDKDVALLEELRNQLENVKKEKAELLDKMQEKRTVETDYRETIISLEDQLEKLTFKLQGTHIEIEEKFLENISQLQKTLGEKEETHKEIEEKFLENISQLRKTLGEKEETIKCMAKEHEEELEAEKTLVLKKIEGSELVKKMESNYDECVRQISTMKEELSKKTNEVLKFLEECRTLRDKVDTMEKETCAIVAEKQELVKKREHLNKKISSLQDEKSNLSNIVRKNLDDLTQAKNVINSLQVKLDQREKSLEVFNKQETDLTGLLFQKHLVGESLLQERQQIVRFLEEKVQENDELKKVRDTLAQNLESKIQVLTEMDAAYRALETKLEVRSHELEVIMEDRNKAMREVENKVIEMTKIKEERDSLVTLMNGKQSEKDQEITKLLSRLKSSQHELALTKKVLEAKKEASEKALRMASASREEITSKRKEMDGLKDRIKWLQDSLQATAEEKMYFEKKVAQLTSQLRNKNRENENIRTELDQIMKYYDSANGHVNQMEVALEKAGIKFAESQGLVEKLEQDLVKIKLQYSLEVKELEMKVRSAEGKGQYVQVVKPFRLQDENEARSPRCSGTVMTSTKELDATKQRLTEEAEMTKGFKTLLKDLRGLMDDIKDSSVMLKRSNASEKNMATQNDVVLNKTCSSSKTSKNHNTHNEDSSTVSPNVALHEPSLKDRGTELKRKHSTGAPLHSSSPKNTSPVFDNGSRSDFTTKFDYSNISDGEPDFSEDEQERSERKENLSQTRRSILVTKSSTLKKRIDSYDIEDVDSLLMPHEVPARSHRRAKKILDLLTIKGQALTNGNKKIAELICRQDDGIKRCQEAEQTIKAIFK